MVDPRILRIIDANLNRAREGMRVLEDFVRFTAEDKKLSRLLKTCRATLSKTIKDIPDRAKLILARDVKKDVAKFLNTFSEMKRGDLTDLAAANIKRVQESLRSLEEFSKLLSTKAAKGFKKLRFTYYQIEKELQQTINRFEKFRKLDFNLYVVTGKNKKGPFTQVKEAIKTGAKIVQYRDKTATKRKYFALARKIARYCKNKNVTFIVNDSPGICKTIDADGVHLGQDDMSIKQARKILGKDKLIGISTHSIQQALKAQKQGADYISFGPIFETPSKPGWKPLGLNLLKKVLKKVKIPVVAIGGINKRNIIKVAQIFGSAKKIPRLAAIRAAKELARFKVIG